MELEKLYQEFNDAYQKWANVPRPCKPDPSDHSYSIKEWGFRDNEWFYYVLARDRYLAACSRARADELH